MRWRVWFIFLIFPVFSAELEERVSSLEAQMSDVGEETPEGSFGASFAPEAFQKGWIGIFFSGSALYWHAKVGGGEYAYSLARNSLGFPLSGETEEHSFVWDWGYRLGIGIRLPIIPWSIVGIYTHFGTQDTESDGGDLFINLKGGLFQPSREVRSRYKIDYDGVDLELRSSSFLSWFFGVETFFGLRGSWIDQVQAVHYSDYHVKDRCRFHGIGPRMGARLKRHLIYGASFLADVTGSLLYGDFEAKHTENQIDLKGSAHLFSANLGFFIGLGWDVYESWYHYGISLGYEAEYYWRQNRMIEVEGAPRLHIVRNVDDLTFYGATLKALLEF